MRDTLCTVWIAVLFCSDDECPEEVEVAVAALDELETLACDCGCTLQVIGFPVWEEPEAEAVSVVLPLAA